MSDAMLGTFTFADEIERFAPGAARSGRRAETLIKTDHLRVVLVTMLQGSTLHEHTAPGPITIQPLRGRFMVTLGGEERELDTGSLIAIGAQAPHVVRALEDGAFLLTIGWPPADSGRQSESESLSAAEG